MSQLLAIYGWTIAASMIIATALALLGAQLAARDKAMQTLCLSQGAMLGVLLGLGLDVHPVFPLVAAMVSAGLTFVISEAQVKRRIASGNTHFASLFAVLLAGGYLISAFFPALENHMAQKYFGDLATLSAVESYCVLALGSCLLLLLSFFYRTFSRESFEKAILSGQRERHYLSAFDIITLLTLCLCVQTVGFLFTIACLFIPTTLAANRLRAGLNRHLWFCGLTAFVASGLGFVLSLESARLPTVPTIVIALLITASIGAAAFAGQKIHR